MDSALDKRGNHHPNAPSEREKALADYAAYLKEGTFLPEASYLAFGTCKQALTLDAIALEALSQKKLPHKAVEKALLRLALYELYYMNAPRYAVGQEWVKLAKKKTHAAFAGFLNALIRNLPELRPHFDDLSVEYSYPKPLVEELLSLFPKETVIQILKQGNLAAETQARIRPGFEVKTLAKEEIPHAIADPDLYLMNRTPAELIKTLASRIPPPETILDLCAAPGGKLVALHDLFPRAALYANDVSPTKLNKIRENLALYGLSAHLTEGKGEDYPETEKFDLVVLDVPCSNTGVFSKHPEARFRISELEPLQKALLAKAKRLVKPGGAIFYLTCSILKREHPEGPKAFEMEILPTEPGTDGGYGGIILAS